MMNAMDTKRLTTDDAARGAAIIASGGLLGIPTETVYGLGANGLDSAAVAAIFAAKGRPQDNPLILISRVQTGWSGTVRTFPPPPMTWPAAFGRDR